MRASRSHGAHQLTSCLHRRLRGTAPESATERPALSESEMHAIVAPCGSAASPDRPSVASGVAFNRPARSARLESALPRSTRAAGDEVR